MKPATQSNSKHQEKTLRNVLSLDMGTCATWSGGATEVQRVVPVLPTLANPTSHQEQKNQTGGRKGRSVGAPPPRWFISSMLKGAETLPEGDLLKAWLRCQSARFVDGADQKRRRLRGSWTNSCRLSWVLCFGAGYVALVCQDGNLGRLEKEGGQQATSVQQSLLGCLDKSMTAIWTVPFFTLPCSSNFTPGIAYCLAVCTPFFVTSRSDANHCALRSELHAAGVFTAVQDVWRLVLESLVVLLSHSKPYLTHSYCWTLTLLTYFVCINFVESTKFFQTRKNILFWSPKLVIAQAEYLFLGPVGNVWVNH